MLAKNAGKVSITLPSDREIRITRVFDWPCELVFEAWTKPDYLRQWWGCATSEIIACEVDLRVGGSWRIVMRMPDGPDQVFRGRYREIAAPHRLVYDECYDMEFCGRPEWLSTITFEDLDGRTKLTENLLHKTPEARDGHLQSGMETGLENAFNRLAELAASIQVPEHLRR